jgi:hypothetical protein
MSASRPRAFAIARSFEAGRKRRLRQSLRSAGFIALRFCLEEARLVYIMPTWERQCALRWGEAE